MQRFHAILIVSALAAPHATAPPAAAQTPPAYTNPQDCLAQAKDSSHPDDKRRAELAECMLKSRSYVAAVRQLERAGYTINATLSKQIEFAETSGQRERAGKLLERVILPP